MDSLLICGFRVRSPGAPHRSGQLTASSPRRVAAVVTACLAMFRPHVPAGEAVEAAADPGVLAREKCPLGVVLSVRTDWIGPRGRTERKSSWRS